MTENTGISGFTKTVTNKEKHMYFVTFWYVSVLQKCDPDTKQ
jgi:hypothetical protein